LPSTWWHSEKRILDEYADKVLAQSATEATYFEVALQKIFDQMKVSPA